MSDPSSSEALREETLSSERMYDGSTVSLRRDTIRLADNSQVVREVIEHTAAFCCLLIDDDVRIAFCRQG